MRTPEERRAYEREYYRKNPDKFKAKAAKKKLKPGFHEAKASAMRGLRQRHRLHVIELLGAKCMICGLQDIRTLEIDHIQPLKQGGHRRQQASAVGYYREMATEIMSGSQHNYQLLCANCHRIKTWTNGEGNHHKE